MADNTESIGGVSVAITGDASGLGPAFTAAQSQAAQAGTQIAAAFNTATAATEPFTVAINRLAGILRDEGEATRNAITQTASLGKSFQGLGGAAQGAHVNTRFLVFGLKDLAEGRGTFAMAELVNVVSRLGPVFIGAAAGLAVMAIPLLSAIVKTKELADAEKELAEATKAADSAFAQTEKTLTDLTVKEVAAAGGAVLGKNAEIEAMRQRLARIKTDIQDAADQIPAIAAAGAGSIKNYVPINNESHSQATIDKIKAQGQVVKDLAEQYRELEGQIDAAAGKDLTRITAQERGQSSAASIALREAQLAQQSARSKAHSDEEITQARDAAKQRIAATVGEYDRVVAIGAAEIEEAKAKQRAITNALASEIPERIRLARAAGAAEQAGRPLSEQQRIGLQTEAKVVGIQTGADKQTTDAQANVVAAQQKATVSLIELNERLASTLRTGVLHAYEDIVSTTREAGNEQQKNIVRATEELDRELEGRAAISEAAAKAQGEIASAQIKAQYELQGTHSVQQEITYRQTLLVIQEQQQAAELNALNAKLEAAKALEDETEKSKQVLEIQRQIVALRGQSQAANIGAQGQIGQLQNQQNLGYEIGQDFKQALQDLPQKLGPALASGLFGGNKGESEGKAIRQALQGIGQELVGKAFSQLIQTIIVQSGLQAAFNALFPTVQSASTVATTANTAALIANTAAVAAGGGASAAGGAASAAGGVASSAASLGTAAATGGASMLAPIIGGVISGVISAAATFIGDAGIIKAVNATTAAVLSLHQTVATGSTTNGSSQPSLAAPSQSIGGQIAASLFTALTGAGALDVNVVSISPIAIGAGFLHLFGFASGTNSAPGGFAMVGEKGPEIMYVPRGAQITPNHKIGSYAGGTSGARSFSSSSSTSIGELHVHAHGVSNPDAFAKAAVAAIPREIKRQTSKASPYSN